VELLVPLALLALLVKMEPLVLPGLPVRKVLPEHRVPLE
jgi:hypothetical protein